MKKTLLLFAGILLFIISSCSYKTCPTYSSVPADHSNTVSSETSITDYDHSLDS